MSDDKGNNLIKKKNQSLKHNNNKSSFFGKMDKITSKSN